MNSFRKVISIKTDKKEEIINITGRVREILSKSEIKEGLLLVYSMHTSSGVYISDSDTSLNDDLTDLLSDLIPEDKGYKHNLTDYKKNAPGHLKVILSSHHVVVPVTEGRMDLGTYQTIYYSEFDGMREKEVLVKIMGE